MLKVNRINIRPLCSCYQHYSSCGHPVGTVPTCEFVWENRWFCKKMKEKKVQTFQLKGNYTTGEPGSGCGRVPRLFLCLVLAMAMSLNWNLRWTGSGPFLESMPRSNTTVDTHARYSRTSRTWRLLRTCFRTVWWIDGIQTHNKIGTAPISGHYLTRITVNYLCCVSRTCSTRA